MNITKIFLGVLLCLAISVVAFGEDSRSSKAGVDAAVPDDDTTPSKIEHSRHDHSHKPPLKPYPRLLPLELIVPSTAQVGIPLDGVSVNLHNPGGSAPNARLRLMIHDKDPEHATDHPELSPDNVKVEVLENGSWKPVLLGLVEDGVMGAIGPEGVSTHRERHQRGGFAIPAGLNKTWQLRVTLSLPGTYAIVAAVSPDNGSRHLARPAHSIIVVQ